MDKLPKELVNIIMLYANPRLDYDLNEDIEVYGAVQNKMYEKNNIRLRYTIKCDDGRIHHIYIGYNNIRDVKHSKYEFTHNLRSPFQYDTTRFSKKELMDILKEFYGGGKIPLASKLKNKRQIVQRLMSL